MTADLESGPQLYPFDLSSREVSVRRINAKPSSDIVHITPRSRPYMGLRELVLYVGIFVWVVVGRHRLKHSPLIPPSLSQFWRTNTLRNTQALKHRAKASTFDGALSIQQVLVHRVVPNT